MTLYVTSLFTGLATVAIIILIWRIFKAEGGLIDTRQRVKQRITGLTDSQDQALKNLDKKNEYSNLPSIREFLSKNSHANELATLLKRSGVKSSVSTFLMICTAGGFAIFLISKMYLSLGLSITIAMASVMVPIMVLKIKNQKYVEKFEEYFPDAISIISNSLKAGHGVDAAMSSTAINAPYPVSTEFQRVIAELKLGQSSQGALQHLYERIKLVEVKIFITGLILHEQLGGNLSEILDNLEGMVRDRFALRREVKSLSAEGKLGAYVLFVAPLAVAAFCLASGTPTFKEFLHSSFGHKMITIGVALQVIAFFWIKKIIKIED